MAIKRERVKAPCRRVRVAINAISDLTSKYGSYVYLIELSRTLARSEGIDLLLLVGRGATQSLPDDLRSKAYEVPIPASRSYWQAFYHKQIEDVLLREKVDVIIYRTLCRFSGRLFQRLCRYTIWQTCGYGNMGSSELSIAG